METISYTFFYNESSACLSVSLCRKPVRVVHLTLKCGATFAGPTPWAEDVAERPRFRDVAKTRGPLIEVICIRVAR